MSRAIYCGYVTYDGNPKIGSATVVRDTPLQIFIESRDPDEAFDYRRCIRKASGLFGRCARTPHAASVILVKTLIAQAKDAEAEARQAQDSLVKAVRLRDRLAKKE